MMIERCGHSSTDRAGNVGRMRHVMLPLMIAVMTVVSTAQAQEAAPRAQITPEELTIDHINDGIEKAIAALYGMKPSYAFLPHHGNYHRQQDNIHLGSHALACWALLESGESFQTPDLFRRINLVLSLDVPMTYFRGMRAQMLAEMPRRWRPWVHRDAVWFEGALTDQGNFGASWTGGKAKGFGDHANGQYGVLGLFGCERAGRPIERKMWQAIDKHWRATQDGTSGGWAVGPVADATETVDFNRRVSGPMTAGGVSVLSLTERYLYGAKMHQVGRTHTSTQLQKGLDWLNTNFSLADPQELEDFYYYMWTVQRVGHISGFRTLNGIDWYRAVTAQMLNAQQTGGYWDGPKGRVLSTGFALLYLAQARSPVAVVKLQHNATWQNRPHDVRNFIDYASDVFEVPLTWYIAQLDQPVYELIEAPILYMATHEKFALSKAHADKLRAYLEAGGLLFFTPEGPATQQAVRSMRDLGKQMFPDLAWRKIDEDHPVTRMHRPLGRQVRLETLHNGIRPMVVMATSDISEDLQINNRADLDSFTTLTNTYLYVSGRKPRSARMTGDYKRQLNLRPRKPASIARIQHAGKFDPEPIALDQLKAILANDHDVNAAVSSVTPAQLKKSHQITFMTTTGDARLDEAEATAIRAWLEGGGTMWLDAAGGADGASRQVLELAKQIMPGVRPSPINELHPIVKGHFDCTTVSYRLYSVQRMGRVTRPRLLAMEIEGRPALIMSAEDITAALAGLNHWEIFGYSPESARHLVINSILDVITEKKPKPEAKPKRGATTGDGAAETKAEPPGPKPTDAASTDTAPAGSP
ncbi:MAG: hypothetical protein CMJ49_02885 [Planctomycetaceae bacterium]|nr:hypothetical protein [Planctomycetaceae bacterium]